MKTTNFNQNIIQLQEQLKYYALSLTQSNDDADDLLQETYLKALLNKEKYTEESNIKAWMYTIMKNTFINGYRRAKRASTFNDTTDNNYFINQSSDKVQETTDSLLSEKEINKRIDQLDEDLKRPFKMHTNGFKYKEIAEKMDIPIGTVKSRIFFSRQKLASELKEFQS